MSPGEFREIIELATRNGFALVFACWALFRLDRFLLKLVENEAREVEIQHQLVAKTDKLSELIMLAKQQG